MFSLILFSLLSSAEAIDCITRKTILMDEKQCAVGPQIYLQMKNETDIPKKKTLVPFTEISLLLKHFLYPSLGYEELFGLLGMDTDPIAPYKFQKLMIRILINRINLKCVESNEELCSYLLSRYNECDYEHGFIQKLRAWREELKSQQAQDTLEYTPFQKPKIVKTLPYLSKQGRQFLLVKSGITSRQISDKELLDEYNKLPDPLRRAVCLGNDGGRNGFDTSLDEMCGISLSSIEGPKKSAVIEAKKEGWNPLTWLASCFRTADEDRQNLLAAKES